MLKRPFAVLDRDGTIIFERHYLSDPSKVELIPGVAYGLRKLSKIGMGLIVITNQSAIGRGLFDYPCLTLIHRRLRDLLASEDIYLDGVYVCPHRPDENCLCRKPRTKLIKEAARDLSFKLQDCFVIGDKVCDVEMGNRVGATTFLVRTGYGNQLAKKATVTPDYIVNDVVYAAEIIEHLLAGRLGKESL